MLTKTILNSIGFGIGIVILLMTLQCDRKAASTANLPKDIFGISVGMSKEEAQKRLEEIARFVSEDRKTGQLWEMKNDPRFKNVAVGYDAEKKIRFVTAMVDKTTAQAQMRFSDVADLGTAEKQVVASNYKYYWNVPARDDTPAYKIFIYGDNPDFLTLYSLSKGSKTGEPKEEEEEDE